MLEGYIIIYIEIYDLVIYIDCKYLFRKLEIILLIDVFWFCKC